MNSPSRSVTNSIKGRIWLAAGSLAVMNCVVGLGAYLTLSFLSADPLLILIATFFVISLLTIAFGGWLASDVLRPVESVTLLAKSLERSPSASLPRTTGAIETDQLLQTLHRSGQQLRNLISLMDDVAAGKIEAAAMPLESSDKLSASFQKLVSKVTDSISAKQDLDDFRNALTQLSNDVSGVRNGKLDLSIGSTHPQTKEVGDTIRFLATRLAELTRHVFATGSECERTVAEARAGLRSALETIDERAGMLPSGTLAISEGSSRLDGLLDELSATVKNSLDALNNFGSETTAPSEVSNAGARLRSGFEETLRSAKKLRNRSTHVSQSARLASDLAKRSNLIALNISLVSDGSPATEHLLKEMESLSAKAGELHRQLTSSVESLNSEIAGFEKELSSLSDLSPKIDKALNASLRTAGAFSETIETVGELGTKIRSETEETTIENARLVQTIQKLSDLSLAAAVVRETDSSVQRLSSLFENLRASISDLSITTSVPNTVEAVKATPAMPVSDTGFGGLIDISSRNGEN
ncbi:MAG TPA: methyl-accepting chemotaxis protein [Pyrinomonadaceae bacterium]